MLDKMLKAIFGIVIAMGLVLTQAKPGAAQANYRVQPGDTLQVEVLEDASLNRAVLVLPDGSFSFPLAGTLRASGRSVEQIRQALATALAPNFAAPPNVFVSVGALAQREPVTEAAPNLIDAYILGEIAAPGRKEVKPGTTLLQLLAESGGLTKFAADKRIELHRTDPQSGRVTTYRFNYRTPAGGASGISGSTRLAPGDVIKIPQRRLFE